MSFPFNSNYSHRMGVRTKTMHREHLGVSAFDSIDCAVWIQLVPGTCHAKHQSSRTAPWRWTWYGECNFRPWIQTAENALFRFSEADWGRMSVIFLLICLVSLIYGQTTVAGQMPANYMTGGYAPGYATPYTSSYGSYSPQPATTTSFANGVNTGTNQLRMW